MAFPHISPVTRAFGIQKEEKIHLPPSRKKNKKIQNVFKCPHTEILSLICRTENKLPPLASSNTKCTGIHTLGGQTPFGLSPS